MSESKLSPEQIAQAKGLGEVMAAWDKGYAAGFFDAMKSTAEDLNDKAKLCWQTAEYPGHKQAAVMFEALAKGLLERAEIWKGKP